MNYDLKKKVWRLIYGEEADRGSVNDIELEENVRACLVELL
jgi:hypothetical protein